MALLYLCNRIVAEVPSHTLRLAFYRRAMAFEIGKRSFIFMGASFDCRGGFSLGDHSVINERCRLDNRGTLRIGRNVSISSEVCILTADHDPQSESFEGRNRAVEIEDYVFIGTRALILPGCKIGRGAIVAAGFRWSRKMSSQFAIVAGNPAKIIGQRPQDLELSARLRATLLMNTSLLQLLPAPLAPSTASAIMRSHLRVGLRDRHNIDSVFVAHETETKTEIDSFRIFPLQEFSRARVAHETCNGVILHYVNYGFQKRGVPVTLVSFLKSLRREFGGALLVIFHELFASGPPWRSEFWLQPLQKKIARDLARLADARVVSCESMRDQLERLSPGSNADVRPVTSTWGEPALDDAQLRERDPHCWVICGGTALVERSLRSFLKMSAPLNARRANSSLSAERRIPTCARC